MKTRELVILQQECMPFHSTDSICFAIFLFYFIFNAFRWGCPTTMMWVYKIGAERAKRMLLTGDLVNGKEAERVRFFLSLLENYIS